MNPGDVDAIVRTVAGEAGGEPALGQQAVASVILNRASATGLPPSAIVSQPGQFEAWHKVQHLSPDSPVYQNVAATIAPVLSGDASDPTGGATHFLNPDLQAQLGREQPNWASGDGHRIGKHVFYGGDMAAQTASAPSELPNANDIMKAYGWTAPGDQTAPAASAAPAASPSTAPGDMPSPDDLAKAYGWKPNAAAPAVDAAPAQAPGIIPAITGFMANVNRGLGVGDEVAAAGNTAVNALTGKTRWQDIPSDFTASMAHQRQLEASYADAHPHVAALARGTGNALTMAAPIGPGAEAFTGGNMAINALKGATTAGVTGAGFAALDAGTPEERLRAAADAATPWKNPLGFGVGAVAGGLAGVGVPKAGAPSTPSLEDLQTARTAAYKEVSDSGAQYTPEATKDLAKQIISNVADAGFDPGLHPKAARMLDIISDRSNQAAGYTPSPSQLDQLRQNIGRDVAGSSDAGERRMGVIMKKTIDGFMGNATPDQITGAADPAAVAQTLATARDLNTRVAKLEKLDGLDEAAADRASVTGSGANINNTTRQNVLRFKNQVKNLTPEEEAAAQTVISGTPTGNLMRKIGKTSPGNGGLMANMHLVGAELSHGATVPIGIGASIAKFLGDASTTRNVQALRNIIATGGAGAAELTRQLADPQYADLRAQLANDLSAQAGVQGASQRGSVTAEIVGHPEYGVGASSQ